MGLSLKNVEWWTLGSGKDLMTPLFPSCLLMQRGRTLRVSHHKAIFTISKANSSSRKYQWKMTAPFSQCRKHSELQTFHPTLVWRCWCIGKWLADVVKDQIPRLPSANSIPDTRVESQVSQAWLDQTGVHLDIEGFIEGHAKHQYLKETLKKKQPLRTNSIHPQSVIEDPKHSAA